MDIVAPFPLVKTGLISETLNLWLALPIGFIFGFALFHSGFTDSRRIAWAFYFKDMGVPAVMFSAIVTGMLGLWGLGLLGILDLSKVYFLPTFLIPMAVGGLLFGMGMVIGGFCPGTAIASIATGKIDAVVFIGGFLIGSMVFGDLFPVWGDFYNSDYRGVFRLDELFGIPLGAMLFIVVLGFSWDTLFDTWNDSLTRAPEVGRTLFVAFSAVQFGLVGLVVPLLGAGALVEERVGRSLGPLISFPGSLNSALRSRRFLTNKRQRKRLL